MSLASRMDEGQRRLGPGEIAAEAEAAADEVVADGIAVAEVSPLLVLDLSS